MSARKRLRVYMHAVNSIAALYLAASPAMAANPNARGPDGECIGPAWVEFRKLPDEIDAFRFAGCVIDHHVRC